MKKIIPILIYFVIINTSSFSQINRVYANFGVGTKWSPDMGLFVHGYEHFSIGILHNFKLYPTGPIIYDHAFPIPHKYQFEDYHRYFGFFAGLTTNYQKVADISFLIGPSVAKYRIYSDIIVKTDYYGDHFDSWNREEYSKVGICARVDFSITFSKIIGMNLALEGNKNSYTDYFRFIVGLNLGRVRNF